MGVHGLWKLIEPSGQIVPLETLAGKVLAVDVSIWLHQAVKGMQDAHGAPVAVAHLLILFHRICKLLFYKIKPVFVFDGGVPALKRQTIAARRQRTSAAKNEAVKVREKLIKNLLKHEAVRQLLSNETASAALGLNSFTLPGPSVEEDLYKLPPIAADYVDSESEAEETSEEESEKFIEDIHSIDVTTPEFLNLPPEVRHDILTELIETRKQSSWKHLDSMPKKSDSFSDFQMNRLLKRHAVQTSLEKAGKEMGGRTLSLKELESILGDQGILDPKIDLPSRRIAQDNVTRYMFVQKDSTEKKEKDFDINEHLGDVGWSSESDTDIILERTSKKQTKHDRPKLQEGSTQSVPITEISNQCDLLSGESKFRINKDVADILSVLEHENMTSDASENTEIITNVKTDLNENMPESSNEIYSKIICHEEKGIDQEVKNSVYREKSVNELKEDVKLHPESTGNKEIKMAAEVKNETAVKNVSNVICIDEQQDEQKEDVESRLSIFSNGNKIQICNSSISESLIHPTVEEIEIEQKREGKDNLGVIKESKNLSIKDKEQSPAIHDTSENAEEMLMSSSDSEKDFVPIDTKDDEHVFQMLLQNSSPVNQTSDNSDSPITVVINPLNSEAKDDIFADIFVSKDKQSESVEDGARETQNLFGAPDGLKSMVNQFSGRDVDLKKVLEQEHEDLMKEKGRQERQALNPTDQMYNDAQELLRLFGIPFVVAPMEAEAQCAALNLIGLTEGTITDDSDIWLFGGQVVYKNFFNQTKHVLEYRSENIHKFFKLTREEMIKMALLVGSDYTVGLNGIGPVTALEILAAFQTPHQGLLDGLQNFRDWFTGKNKEGPQRIALRKKIKNTVILPGFPNRSVVEAYLNPEVDDSKEPFSWAKPNLEMIRKYVKARLGWSSEKCNDLLRPVLKKLEETTNQSTLQRHFKIIQKQPATEKIFSKRVEKALRRLANDSPDHDNEPEEKQLEQEQEGERKRKRKFNSAQDAENISTNARQNKRAMTKRKSEASESNVADKSAEISQCSGPSKIKLINQKLHQNLTVPQKELTQKMLENRKQEAIKIFRTFKKGKKKTKVYAKEKATLSESSSGDD